MENRYKLVFFNKTIYKEVELTPECRRLCVGTYYDDDVRLEKELFSEDFYVALNGDGAAWEIECSANAYIDRGDIRKLLHLRLDHGDQFALRFQSSNMEFLKLTFVIDFDYGDKKYDSAIQLVPGSYFTIGGSGGCDICLNSIYTASDSIGVTVRDRDLLLNVGYTSYGVCKNGLPAGIEVTVRDFDFFSVANYYFYYKDHLLYTDIDDSVSVNGMVVYQDQGGKVFDYPKFNRSTRVRTVVPDEPIPILDPPMKPEKPKNNILISIMPAVVMLILTIVVRGFMGGGSAFMIFSVCTIAMGIVTSVITYVQGKKEYRQKIEERETSYREYIDKKRLDIIDARNLERTLLDHIYPGLDVVIGRIMDFSGELFERTTDDADYLCVRLGTGPAGAMRRTAIKDQERFVSDDALTYLPQEVERAFHDIEDSPIRVSLRDANAVGVVGDDDALCGMARNMVLDLAGRHYFGDVKFCFLMNERQKPYFEWVRHLPHVRCDGSMARYIACDDDSRTSLFEMLYKEFSMRAEMMANAQNKNAGFAHMLIFVLDASAIMTHPISKFIANAREIGVTFIFFANRKESLPLWCSSLIHVDGHEGDIVHTADENQTSHFTYEPAQISMADAAATKLAPVYCEEVSLEGSLAKSVSLFDVLNIYSVEDLDLSRRWEESRVERSMAAPLGVKTKNEIVYLDIHERAHGPHGLVAGTTGSGKSEILQSYILSMATLFHPYEVGFMIIDFKGGGMANQFAGLPHLIGTITNIDGKQIDRSLMSIRAELLKRQTCFAEADVNHIDKYIQKYKNHEVEKPLPHLIIIVDEFAELRAEQPEFMKELISAARIGRSLGVHLILATQKPSGQVNEQIWSNSRFKLCLKVQSPEDSNEMIKSPLAAEIIEPGRAYFQVGNNEIFELFQSGYSGAPEKVSADTVSSREYKISEVSFSGRRKCIFEQRKKATASDRTQLEALVAYINGYCAEKGIARLDSICLPPLPEIINYPDETALSATAGQTYGAAATAGKVESEKTARGVSENGAEIVVDIGIYDDPEHQRQDIASINLTQSNTIIIGSSQYGKTNLLQTIIRGLCTRYTPQEVNIYIMDFGSMVLKNFEDLRHVGGVVCSYEDEKFKNLFRMLAEEINTRKDKMMKAGVSSFTSYREAGLTDLPQIVLMVDHFTAVRELYLQDEDPLLAVCRDGLAVGISVVICNQQTSGLGYRYLSNFAKRIALYCNESGEYVNVIDKCRIAPDQLAGRGVTEIDRKVYEMQTYLCFEGEREIERVSNMRAFVAACNARCHGSARRIPEIPSVLTETILKENYGISREATYQVPVALRYDTVSVLSVDLLRQGVFGIVGRPGSGRRNLLHVIMDQLYDNIFTAPSEVYIVDGHDRLLKDFEAYSNVVTYSIDAADLIEYVDRIHGGLEDIYDDFVSGEADLSAAPLKLVIVASMEAITMLCKNSGALKRYKDLTGRFKNMKVCFIFMNVDNEPISYSAPEILKNIKDAKNFFYFDDLANLKICDVPTASARRFKKKISVGDGYWLSGSEIVKIKTVINGR